jgi:hypothetical protein
MENNTPEQKSLKQQQDELIIKHLEKFGQNNLFRASLDHFIETGMPSGSFYLSLCEMLSEHASQQNEALQLELETKDVSYLHLQNDAISWIVELKKEKEALQAQIRAGERLRMADAASAINEANELRQKITDQGLIIHGLEEGSDLWRSLAADKEREIQALQKRVQEKEKEAAMWYDDTITLQKEVERLKGWIIEYKNQLKKENVFHKNTGIINAIDKALNP